MTRLKRNGGMLLLGLASLGGVGATAPARNFYCSAHQFVTYYRAIGDSQVQAGFMERVAISLALVSADSQRPPCPHATPVS